MAGITPFLMFNDQLDRALELYQSMFPDMVVTKPPFGGAAFTMGGQHFMAYNGGPHFKFTEGMSLFVDCADQAEVDYFWQKILAAGGTPTACGWINDPFGISWQIVPRRLMELLGDPDRKKAQATQAAMLEMVKLDVATLEKAAAEA